MKPIEKIVWETGTAYDFIVSLIILHDPKRYGLRPKWASAIRQRLPQSERNTLEMLMEAMVIAPPLYWIYENVSEPKDGKGFLNALRSLNDLERIIAILGIWENESPYTEFVTRIIKSKKWNQDDLGEVQGILKEMGKAKSKEYLTTHLEIWAKILDESDAILASLQAYYDAFFASEEYRISAAAQEGLKEARRLATELSFTEFFEKISQGILYEEAQFAEYSKFIFAPSFWASPFVFMSLSKTPFYLFGVRPDDASLMPGEVIPDVLINSITALSDPTRLRILRYLSAETLTPTQIANRLHLRTSTVAHHLNILRAVGLVVVRLKKESKKEVHYSTRIERLEIVCKMLSGFVNHTDLNGGLGE